MKSVKEPDGIVEERTVLCLNQAEVGVEAGEYQPRQRGQRDR